MANDVTPAHIIQLGMGFWGPKRSKELVNGAKSVWHRGFIDFVRAAS